MGHPVLLRGVRQTGGVNVNQTKLNNVWSAKCTERMLTEKGGSPTGEVLPN